MEHIRNGRFEHLGVLRDANVLPITVTFDFGVEPLVMYGEVVGRLTAAGVSSEVTDRIQFLDSRDLELLELAEGQPDGILGLLRQKAAEPPTRAMSLANYCYYHASLPQRHNSVLDRAFARAHRLVEEYLSARRAPVAEDESAP